MNINLHRAISEKFIRETGGKIRPIKRREVAEKVGMHPSTLSSIVSGRIRPSQKQQAKLARYFRVRKKDLFPDLNPPKNGTGTPSEEGQNDLSDQG